MFFILGLIFDFYVSKIMHSWTRNLLRKLNNLVSGGSKAEQRARDGRPKLVKPLTSPLTPTPSPVILLLVDLRRLFSFSSSVIL